MLPVKNIFVKFRVINGTPYLALQYELFELDEVGHTIWESMDGERSVEKIAEILAGKYKVDQDQVITDTREFIAALIENKLAEAL
jgi:hypothetical protein